MLVITNGIHLNRFVDRVVVPVAGGALQQAANVRFGAFPTAPRRLLLLLRRRRRRRHGDADADVRGRCPRRGYKYVRHGAHAVRRCPEMANDRLLLLKYPAEENGPAGRPKCNQREPPTSPERLPVFLRCDGEERNAIGKSNEATGRDTWRWMAKKQWEREREWSALHGQNAHPHFRRLILKRRRCVARAGGWRGGRTERERPIRRRLRARLPPPARLPPDTRPRPRSIWASSVAEVSPRAPPPILLFGFSLFLPQGFTGL